MNFGGVDFKFEALGDGVVDIAQFERELYSGLEREYPDLWHTCYPRIYHDPRNGQYYSSKKPAQQMMLIALKIMTGQVGESEKYEYHLASHLAQFRTPMFWLSPAIAEALRLTTPPGIFDWYNMPMPFDAGVFMMPKGSLVHKTDGDVSFICYSRMRVMESHQSRLFPGKRYMSGNGGMVLAAAVQGGYFIHWNIPLDWFGPKVTMAQLQKLMMEYRNTEHRSGIPLRPGAAMTDADHQLGLDVAHYIFSTLMLMTARPDLVTGASFSHRIPAKKHKEPKEFWNPAIIGEHYKARREPHPSQGGTHASPRFHWVQGFWREQPYGPKRELRHTKWIEPYTRGGDQP